MIAGVGSRVIRVARAVIAVAAHAGGGRGSVPHHNTGKTQAGIVAPADFHLFTPEELVVQLPVQGGRRPQGKILAALELQEGKEHVP